ncbi:MAG: translation elongation factor Ts [Candidatus Omnitrophica bacterium]|nr:translation elongation factor Ts [Candidatus Omnitrophota bacterium]MDD5236352.1 translation elongation factor Ts [Candidatus Omnitrophota bacterium]MDD5611072.1 translation elongation factor Ts [Candidatus Omnitrophota bacterium]
MQVSLDLIKELRKTTSASVADCRKALEDAGSDIKKAMEILRKRGLEIAQKKQDRAVHEGRVESYVHLGNKIGVLLEVNCETDFVARNDDFRQFTKDVAMQIAAVSPRYIKKEDVPQEILESYKDKEAYYKENCLLLQPFIKDPGMTIQDYLTSIIAKIGENIVIRRFTRYKLGE